MRKVKGSAQMIDYEKVMEGVGGPAVLDPTKIYTLCNDTEEDVIVLDSTASVEELREKLAGQSAPTEEQQLGRDHYSINHPRYQGLAEDKGYSQEYSRIAKTRYSHEALIDVIIANPTIKQVELAKQFEKTQAWMSRIIGSDAFQAALAKRREELTDPFLIATIEERFRGLAMQSLDVIADKLEQSQNADLALKALDISSKALGFGARGAGSGGAVQNNFVIQLPPKIDNAKQWADEHSGPTIEG